EDGIFLSQDEYVGDILNKFGYLDVRSSNTPMDKENPWGKDGTRKDVDLHLYRSMVGSLMYLTASRPDIMFAVCAYARHQVTPKECHLHTVKRIFRYLKGHPKLGLWYPKDSPFDLVAYSDSDYGDEPASPVRDVSEGEACPTDFDFIADQDKTTIAKSSTLPHDTAPMVTSPVAVEGTQEVEINKLKEGVKVLKDNQGVIGARSTDDTPIKGRRIDEEEGITGRVSTNTKEIRMDEGEVAVERTSEDTEELATGLTSMDAATVLAGGIDVPTGSYSIPTAGPHTVDIHTGSEVVPTASPIVATATVVTPYLRRKGKEVMVESDTQKKQRLQEKIHAQVARELEDQPERKDKRMTEQITRDAEVARIHAEEELHGMIDSLDRTNETIAEYLQEYQDFASELPLERRIELISNLEKYQDNYSKIYKFQSQQRRPWTKKQKKDYYMTKLVKDFIPMGSKEEAKRLKKEGFNLEQEKAKKQKTSEEVPDKEKSSEEILEEKVKEMMQLVPIEEVYVQALQVKHPIIDWKVHIEGQRSYWKIIRLGGSSACYQFFVDLLKHLDREDLNQLWVLEKEYLSIRPASSDKEIEL
nr:hypothetical protein [Tanacetum cinerariifolium]